MKLISKSLLIILMMLFAFNSYAKPGFVVLPFAKNINMAPNTVTNVLIVAQNQTTVNQTVTNVVPKIPASSGIKGTATGSNCGFLSPGSSCETLIQLHSGNHPSVGDLNVSVCSFNGAYCSRIVKPLPFINTQPVRLFVFPTTPSIANHTTQQFYAIGLFSNFTIEDVTNSVTWISSNNSKAVISNASGSNGLATGISPGIVTIAATLGKLLDATKLTITPATLVSISITPVNSSIAKGTTQQFIATGIFSDNSNQDITSLVTWGSTNNTVATVANTFGQKGLATGRNVGATTITATFRGVSGSTNLNVTSATLIAISVTPTNPIIEVLTFQQFTATGIYSDNSVQDLSKVVTWGSQLSQVAIISNQSNTKGLALGVGVGSTVITAKLGAISGSTTLRVQPAILIQIEIQPINATIPLNSVQPYVATGVYSNGRNQDITQEVTWLSSNTNIATISNAPGSNGLAKGIQGGTVIISATLGSVVGTTHLTVNNPTLVSITVTPAASTTPINTQQQFTATGNYSDSSTQNLTQMVTWLSSATSVATISNASGTKGLAQAIAPGATTISATLNGITGSTPLTVSGPTLVSISVTPANAIMPTNTNQPFTATGTYSDASTKNITQEVTWQSTNNSVATISNAVPTKGVATGVAPGSTTILAIKNTIMGSTTLTVQNFNVGDILDGGYIACLNGGLNDLIAAFSDNSNAITWGGNGIITNGQSTVNGGTNTIEIVTVLGPGLTYAAGICDAYEIDSAGNTPCVGGNTCYNDWFLAAIDQLTCLRDNKNKIPNFAKTEYWSSTEDQNNPSTNAISLTFANSGQGPVSSSKTQAFAVRCVRIINAAS